MSIRGCLAMVWLVGCGTVPMVEGQQTVTRMDALEAELVALTEAVHALEERCEEACEVAQPASPGPCVVHNSDGTVTVRPCGRPDVAGPADREAAATELEAEGLTEERERRREVTRRRLRERWEEREREADPAR